MILFVDVTPSTVTVCALLLHLDEDNVAEMPIDVAAAPMSAGA